MDAPPKLIKFTCYLEAEIYQALKEKSKLSGASQAKILNKILKENLLVEHSLEERVLTLEALVLPRKKKKKR